MSPDATNPGFFQHKDHNMPIFLLVLIALLGFGKLWADDVEANRYAAQIAPMTEPSEYIKTTGINVSNVLHKKSGGKFSIIESSWVSAESGEWLLVNGDRPYDFCPSALRTFTTANDLSAPSLVELRLIESGYRDKPLELHVVVPRFKVAPDGLQDCIGFSHDPATGMLMVGSKKVAYLLEQQPRLRAEP